MRRSAPLRLGLAVLVVLYLNWVTFLYFLADSGSATPWSRFGVFAVLLGAGAVAFARLVDRWWLVFIGEAGVLLIGARALVLFGGFTASWLGDLAAVLVPLGWLEAVAFGASRLRAKAFFGGRNDDQMPDGAR